MDGDETRSAAVATGNSSEPCCAGSRTIDEDALAGDLQLLSAMSNDTRYELLRRIAAADGEVCVCTLEEAVDVSQSAVSQSLSRLHSADLVSRRKEGSWRYYGTTTVADRMLAALDDLRAGDE